jgi:hypothetical protein
MKKPAERARKKTRSGGAPPRTPQGASPLDPFAGASPLRSGAPTGAPGSPRRRLARRGLGRLARYVKKTAKKLGIKIVFDNLQKEYEKGDPLLVGELPGPHTDSVVFVHSIEYGAKKPRLYRPMRISYSNIGDEYWALSAGSLGAEFRPYYETGECVDMWPEGEMRLFHAIYKSKPRRG